MLNFLSVLYNIRTLSIYFYFILFFVSKQLHKQLLFYLSKVTPYSKKKLFLFILWWNYNNDDEPSPLSHVFWYFFFDNYCHNNSIYIAKHIYCLLTHLKSIISLMIPLNFLNTNILKHLWMNSKFDWLSVE